MSDEWSLPDAAVLTRIAWRLGSAALLGGLIGIEREWMGKAAGLRTHTTVALAAAAFVLVGIESGGAEGDLGRIIQGVAAGVGFLGAGTILKRKEEEAIEGLTTAATIWLTAAIGVAAGAGQGAIAAICVVAAMVILTILSGVNRIIHRR
jgi:putative Mg2+ transporter-C (MgtC) family protein